MERVMNTQPEALRLANALGIIEVTAHGMNVCDNAACTKQTKLSRC